MWEDEWAADMGNDAPKIKWGWNFVPDDKVWLSPAKRKREEEEEKEKEKEKDEKKKLKSVKDFFAPLAQATFGAVPAAVAAAATPEERIEAAVAVCLKKRANMPKSKPKSKKPKSKK
ncbi:hypothetical protein FBULB1_3326 [Fusarium bulbicola]|nr:hypothetical protein FBULB1_3326 [Fusarium bulbicola]